MKHLKTLLTLFLIILGTLLKSQTASNNVCVTPNEYRFYVGALIDKQVLVKDTAKLNKAIRAYQFAAVKDSTAMAGLKSVVALGNDKEAIYQHDINLLQDDVDKYKTKTVRNRKIAIVGFGAFTLETALIVGGLYLYSR